jgi:hypothetical protein
MRFFISTDTDRAALSCSMDSFLGIHTSVLGRSLSAIHIFLSFPS